MNGIYPLVTGIVCALTLAGLGVLWHRQRTLQRLIAARDSQINELTTEVHALLASARGLGEQLQRGKQELGELELRVERMEMTDGGENDVALKARQLLKQGYALEDIACVLDLSLSELQLLSAMVRQGKVA